MEVIYELFWEFNSNSEIRKTNRIKGESFLRFEEIWTNLKVDREKEREKSWEEQIAEEKIGITRINIF